MSQAPATTRTRVEIDGRELTLTPGHDIAGLMSRIEEAARAGGAFVHFPSGDLLMSVLISSHTHVTIAVEVDSFADPPADLSEHARTDWYF